MKKRARICFYIFVVCAFFALGILGYYIFSPSSDNVMVGSKKFVTFNEVPNASVYAVSVKDENNNYLESKAYYKITKSTTEDKNKFKFNTQVEIDNIKVAEESYEQVILFEKDEKINCSIKNYKVTFFNELGEITETMTLVDQTLTNVDKNTFCCVISEYFETIFIEDGVYNIEMCAIDENGNEIDNSTISYDYNYEAYYLREFSRRPSFFMNGFEIDFVIDDNKEFEEFVWHSILYRENEITFYCNTSTINASNINRLTIDAIRSYPEYDGLYSVSTYASLNNNVGKLFNFYYYLDFNSTKDYTSLRNEDSIAYNQALSGLRTKNSDFNKDYIKKQDATGERNFPIDSVETEVLVYNTEQLFMVAQYGAKPVFLDEGDPDYKEDYAIVKTIYNNAREELKTINNSDELTDGDKALNIYRYLCENVIYDEVLYMYMEITDNHSIYSFGSYACFHLEGVFLNLDKQYAVCDGIAKAYTLMCRIEGIPCVKVNGKVGIGTYDSVEEDGLPHAWNKIGFKNATEQTDQETYWYYVDPTWGVGLDSRTKQEFLTHSYFLFKHSDKLNNETRVVEFASDIDVSNGSGDNTNPIERDFDYYYATYYNYTDEYGIYHRENCLVVSNEELRDILGFVNYKLKLQQENNEKVSYVIEIKFNKFYSQNQFVSNVYNLIYNHSQFDERAWLNYYGFDDNIQMECYRVMVSNDVILFRFYEEPVEQEDV